jgi:D-serine deaminase-like pyridoxal phosphate-dependent protein
VQLTDLTTPALVVDAADLEHNLALMADALPGPRLRPHVKAHKCSELARQQRRHGHPGLTCATIAEAEGLAAAGLGDDVLLANEVLDARRLGRLVRRGVRITVAVDSPETVDAAADGGVEEVVVDVNVGLPRCGCEVGDAGGLADRARRRGLRVRGVMGYEGHAVGLHERARRAEEVDKSMGVLAEAHAAVGGDVVSAGGTGVYDLNTTATEIQAGSYALMDTAYGALDIPFRQALGVLATVVSVNRARGWAVADCGLKALGMDHGDPSLAGGWAVWFCSDEHLTLGADADGGLPRLGDRLRVLPAHIDPTVAYHRCLWVVEGDEVVDRWPVDLRGW